MKVFSKEKYLKRCRELHLSHSEDGTWPDECDGMPVKGDRCTGRNGVTYKMCDTWCINVPEVVKEEKKMYTMKDFINKPIAVRVGQDHKIEFLKMCEAEGLKWMAGQKAAEYTPGSWIGEDLCVAYNVPGQRTGLGWGNTPEYRAIGYTIVDFKDFMAPRYQIIIDCDGKTTTAKMLVDGKEVKTGVAKYNPADKFDFSIGAKVAFDRLWDKPEPVKFKVGDRVKCIKVPDNNKEVVGKYGTVKAVDKEHHILPILVEFDEAHRKGHPGHVMGEAKCKPDHGWWCDLEDLELAKDEPFPFKVGDRVKCTKSVDSNTTIIGKCGTVIHLKHGDSEPVTVEFDENIHGHGGFSRVKGKNGHCWMCPVDALELVTVREVKRYAKVGEWVKIVKAQGHFTENYKTGDIRLVKDVDIDGWVNLDCGGASAMPEEYVVLEGYKG